MINAGTQSKAEIPTRHSSAWVPIVFIVFSIFYFTDVLIRQSEKYFWYDELCTVLYCRLDLHNLALAQHTGLDNSPIVFHLLTKASQQILGSGLLGTRAPEIFGFWVLCLCLFRFVNRRLGLTAGIIAMLFPVLTETFYYAYEARPYGLILGFCGAALVSWQRLLESKRAGRWLLAFSASLLGAFLLHSFAMLIAVPFGIAEFYTTVRTWRIRWRFWIALLLPVGLAIPSHIPVILTYRAMLYGTNFGMFSPHDWGQIPRFYTTLLAPCILLIVSAFAIVATALLWPLDELPAIERSIVTEELIVALCFAALPALGVFVAKAMHVVFFERYFSSALVGICLLLAMALSIPRVSRLGRPAFAALLVMASFWELGGVLWNRHRHIPNLIPEPTGGVIQNVTRDGPLSQYPPLMQSLKTDTPIAITNPVDYLYLVYYSPELRRNLYYVRNGSNDPFGRILDRFRPLSPVPYNSSLKITEALRLAPHVYVSGYDSSFWIIPIVQTGAHIRSLQAVNYRFLADVELGRQ